MDNRDTLIWLNSLNILSNSTIDKLDSYFENISNIWTCSSEEIYKLNFVSKDIKDKLIKNRNSDYFIQYINKVNRLSINILTEYDTCYPESLKYIFDRPKVLYIKGDFKTEDLISLSIVGSRKATSYGKWAAEKLSRELAQLNITIVSGMARGIDTTAHIGALRENGRTIAILGSGIDIIYPSSNKDLYKNITENGCVMSEFPIGAIPKPYNFPMRNRIISGLTLGTIVVEASEKSGSLITAEHALEQGKDVFALPGNINSIYSKGSNQLIKDGAKIVLELEDILCEIPELREKITINKKEKINFDELSDEEAKIVRCIIEAPVHSDVLSYKTGLSISSLYTILTVLEMKGIIKQLPGKIFSIS